MDKENDLSLKLTAQEVLEKKFTPNMKGYDADEVDGFLDLVLADYHIFAKLLDDFNKKIAQLEEELTRLKEKLEKAELSLINYQNRFGNIKEGTSLTAENVDLLNKIGKYETALKAHGIDPKKL